MALKPLGSRSLTWHVPDEVAWLLLTAGFHPWTPVLLGVLGGWEVCFPMDRSVASLPEVHFVIVERANLREEPNRIPRMFGGGGTEQSTPQDFAKLLTDVSTFFPNEKKEKLKFILRRMPGLPNKIRRAGHDKDRVQSLVVDAANRMGMQPPTASTTTTRATQQRAKSMDPPKKKRTAETKQVASDGEADRTPTKKVAFKQSDKPKPPQSQLRLVEEWSVKVRDTFTASEGGIYMSESYQQIVDWMAQVRSAPYGVGVISPFAHQVPGLARPRALIVNMIESRNDVERRISARACESH